jgi:hypothetical protein
MNTACKVCPERGTANCAFPVLRERLGEALSYIGKATLASLAMGSPIGPMSGNLEYINQIRTSRDEQLARREQNVADCATSHQAVQLSEKS